MPTFLLRWVSQQRRVFIEAARAEAESAPTPAEARHWRTAARGLLVRGLLVGPVLNLLVLAMVIAGVVVLNSFSSDVSSQETLAWIVVGSAALGLLWRRLFWLPSLLVGSAVACEHIVSMALRIPEPNLHLPAGWFSTTSLLLLVIPALAAAYAGAKARHLLHGSDA